ncbi:hypothetical protein ACFFHC_10250 [Kytococcus schroeteri]|uniref:hypothetical protein n=1 Tax=Kytococcus schroeteri TaxID=138300 RepID=UPI0035ED6187
MTVSRRSLAKGAAWSVPAVAVAASAPAVAASQTCTMTDEQLNAGDCSGTAASWEIVGARTYGTTGGAVIPISNSHNIGLRSTCNYRGSVTFKLHNTAGEAYIPAPTATLSDGRTVSGSVTLGNVLSGIAQTGWDSSFTINWGKGSVGTIKPDLWVGAVVNIPMELSYTAPDGSLHTCMVTMQYTQTDGYTNGAVVSMGNPTFVAA